MTKHEDTIGPHDSLIDAIVDALDRRDANEGTLYHAARLLEKIQFQRDGTQTSSPESLGWCEHVIRTEASEADTERLMNALIRFAEVDLDSPAAKSAVAALTILRDHRLQNFYHRVLRYHFTRDAQVVYQALFGLERLGVKFATWGPSRSILDVEKTRAIARGYLAQLGDEEQP